MIKAVKKRRFWFNYKTGQVNYISEDRPSNDWRWVECFTYPFSASETEKYLPDTETVYQLYETTTTDLYENTKTIFVGYVVKTNKNTGNLESLYYHNLEEAEEA